MAKIERKFTDFSGAIKDAQTSRIWDIEITSASEVDFEDSLKFRVDEVTDCPPPPQYGDHVKVGIGGYKLNFIGNIDKSGTMGFTIFEDIDGKVTKFVHDVRRAYYVSTASHGVDAVDNVSSELSSGTKFTIKVRLGDTTGEVTKTWVFHKAMMDLGTMAGGLNQEGEAVKFTLNFAYEYFTESNGDETDTW
jgi:hypothetical protein